jgi:negative regulator of flagellin synthesis FlgM
MQIQGPSHLHGAQPINTPHRAPQSQPAAGTSALNEVDQLDISPEADLVSRVSGMPEMRMDRVAEIRAQIASGSYETDAKLDVALDRLLDEIG